MVQPAGQLTPAAANGAAAMPSLAEWTSWGKGKGKGNGQDWSSNGKGDAAWTDDDAVLGSLSYEIFGSDAWGGNDAAGWGGGVDEWSMAMAMGGGKGAWGGCGPWGCGGGFEAWMRGEPQPSSKKKRKKGGGG